jgi:hypothetical protein
MIRLLLLLLAAPACAQTIAPPVKSSSENVVIATNKAATGFGTSAIDTRGGFWTMGVQVTNSAGTSTVALAQSCNGGATWGDVVPLVSSAVPDAASNTTVVLIPSPHPMCAYTINVTACAGCNVSATAYVGAHVQ